jgi:hypothetical protein
MGSIYFDADTEKFYTVVQEKILAEYGKSFDWSLKAKMMGKKALEAGQIFIQDTGLTGLLKPEEFIQRREVMLHAMFPESDLMPGMLNACIIFSISVHTLPLYDVTNALGGLNVSCLVRCRAAYPAFTC